MQTSMRNISIFFTVTVALAITSLTACAGGNYKDPVVPSKDSGLTITFNPEGGLNVEASGGGRLERCFLPCTEKTTEKYNKRCPKVDPAKICKGLIDATVVDVHTITIIENTVNPYCRTVIRDGMAEQICYCRRGEVNPLCRN